MVWRVASQRWETLVVCEAPANVAVYRWSATCIRAYARATAIADGEWDGGGGPVVEGSSRLAYSMGGALASWQMFPARPRHSSSVNLRDAQIVPRRGVVYFPRQESAGHLRA